MPIKKHAFSKRPFNFYSLRVLGACAFAALTLSALPSLTHASSCPPGQEYVKNYKSPDGNLRNFTGCIAWKGNTVQPRDGEEITEKTTVTETEKDSKILPGTKITITQIESVRTVYQNNKKTLVTSEIKRLSSENVSDIHTLAKRETKYLYDKKTNRLLTTTSLSSPAGGPRTKSVSTYDSSSGNRKKLEYFYADGSLHLKAERLKDGSSTTQLFNSNGVKILEASDLSLNADDYILASEYFGYAKNDIPYSDYILYTQNPARGRTSLPSIAEANAESFHPILRRAFGVSKMRLPTTKSEGMSFVIYPEEDDISNAGLGCSGFDVLSLDQLETYADQMQTFVTRAKEESKPKDHLTYEWLTDFLKSGGDPKRILTMTYLFDYHKMTLGDGSDRDNSLFFDHWKMMHTNRSELVHLYPAPAEGDFGYDKFYSRLKKVGPNKFELLAFSSNLEDMPVVIEIDPSKSAKELCDQAAEALKKAQVAHLNKRISNRLLNLYKEQGVVPTAAQSERKEGTPATSTRTEESGSTAPGNSSTEQRSAK